MHTSLYGLNQPHTYIIQRSRICILTYFTAEHHVSFATDTHLDPDPIHLLRSDDPTIPPEAHVGLLSNHHTYSVDIPVPHSLGPVVSAHHTKTNTHFTVTEPPETVEGEDDKFKYVSTIKLQAKTTQEGSIAEKMEVFVGDVTMEILLTAKVVETTQGTPLLKKGVRVVAHEHTAKTEWPGATKPEGMYVCTGLSIFHIITISHAWHLRSLSVLP